MRKSFLAGATAMALFLASSSTAAILYEFAADGGSSPSRFIRFSIPDTLEGMGVGEDEDGVFFAFSDIAYIQGGLSDCVSWEPCHGSFKFYRADSRYGGGLYTPIGLYVGRQLFDGPVTAPQFRTGDFGIDFRDLDGQIVGCCGGTVTITATATSVIEPAAWLLMLGGFGAVGWAARRRVAVSFA